MTPLVDIAIGLQLPCFPCGRNKRPSIAKKDGGKGLLDAVLGPDAIRKLFARCAPALIGVPTGAVSGFDVLDLDFRHGAGVWLQANVGRLPKTRTHKTLHGGHHLLFRHVDGIRNSASKLAEGVDIRGSGGYVIFPPSGSYQVIDDAQIADWPDWLLADVLARPTAAERQEPSGPRPAIDSKRLSGFVDALARKVSAAGDGAKHYTLRNAAISLGGVQVQAGLSDSDAIRILIDALPSTVEDWNAAKATVAWGLEHGRARPITLEDRPEYQRTNGHAHATEPPNQAHESAPPPDPKTFDGLDTHEPLQHEPDIKRTIRVFAGLRHVAADQGLSSMRAAGVEFYQRDRALVRAAVIKAKDADGRIVEAPGIMSVTVPLLGRALGQSAEWEKITSKGEVIRIDPPKEVVEQIAAMSGHWPFPPISGVIGAPTMRLDGSLLTEPGYDEATGLVLMSPPKMPRIPANPSKFDALEALELLESLLAGFPFADPVSLSAALSMILTPVLRGALAPAVPMHVVAAPQAGTGKSYLQDVVSVLATGERCAVVTIAPADPSETEKRLIGAALAGYPIIALDNCNGVLTGDFLAQVTERPLLQLRPLGTSGVIRVANTFTVFANGNNITVSADLVRRTVLCTLDANMENPESRVFEQNPIADILADRGRYIGACLTVARAYVCQKSPNKLPRLASFERWSDLVRSLLVWLGKEDPASGVDTIRAEDPTRNARAAVFDGWAKTLIVGQGYVAGDIIDEAEKYDMNSNAFVHPDFRSALLGIAKSKTADRIDGRRLGWWLHSSAKVVSGKYKLIVDRADVSRPKWKLEEVRRPI